MFSQSAIKTLLYIISWHSPFKMSSFMAGGEGLRKAHGAWGELQVPGYLQRRTAMLRVQHSQHDESDQQLLWQRQFRVAHLGYGVTRGNLSGEPTFFYRFFAKIFAKNKNFVLVQGFCNKKQKHGEKQKIVKAKFLEILRSFTTFSLFVKIKNFIFAQNLHLIKHVTWSLTIDKIWHTVHLFSQNWSNMSPRVS